MNISEKNNEDDIFSLTSKNVKASRTKWFISGNPKKYDCINAFKNLGKIDWKQSINVQIGDIVYIYISGEQQRIRFKCQVNKVNLKNIEIEDSIYNISGEYDGTYGRYMELEMIKEFDSELFSLNTMRTHGFSAPQSPTRVKPEIQEYMDVVEYLLSAEELNPDTHDGSYSLVRSTIEEYSQMTDLSKLDYKDLNLIYLMCIGTWKQKISSKKETIKESHLSDAAKERLISLLDVVWKKAERGEYTNQDHGDVSVGMFGTGFMSFKGKTDESSPREFIQMCIDIKDMTDEEEIFSRCSKTLVHSFKGMRAASASMILHCLKPFVFPIFNSNMGSDNIFSYFGLNMYGKTEIEHYIENTRIVKEYRDLHFNVKNYRLFDMAAWRLNNMKITDSQTETVNFDKNMILYGPPGTGKTYNTATYAVAICDGKPISELTDYNAVLQRYDELKLERRIAFTTFHQSYGYEEFVEGISPVISENDEINNTGDIGYTYKDGIFKKFCDDASAVQVKNTDMYIAEDARVWNINLGGTETPELKERCFNESSIRIGWVPPYWPEHITQDTENLSPAAKKMLLNFQDEMKIGDIVLSFHNNKTIDAIGVITGDSEFDSTPDEKYPRKRTVKWIDKELRGVIALNGGTRLDRKTIYPLWRISANGILSLLKTNNVGMEIQEEIRPYVFVIDEINRGNISKIFGELITLIEDTKRKGMAEEKSAILPYSNTEFSVPDNVYIIGTMNTADCSIALMDTALRRRFKFIEMLPNSDVLRKISADIVEENGETLDVAAMLETINKRIEYLFDREHTIGHAFFTGLRDEPTIEKLANIFQKSIIPLLQEYFYEDYSKIMLVLGDNGKSNDDLKFILDTKISPNDIFKGDTSDLDIPEYSYQIQEKAFYNIKSYIEIYE